MKQVLLLSVAALGLLAADVGRAQAQPPVPGGATSRPALSPYLNLGRTGNPAINYYGLVRPQQQVQQSIRNLQTTLTGDQQQNNNQGGDASGLPPTGRAVGFMNYGSYFMNMGRLNSGQGGGATGGGGTQSFRTPQLGAVGGAAGVGTARRR